MILFIISHFPREPPHPHHSYECASKIHSSPPKVCFMQRKSSPFSTFSSFSSLGASHHRAKVNQAIISEINLDRRCSCEAQCPSWRLSFRVEDVLSGTVSQRSKIFGRAYTVRMVAAAGKSAPTPPSFRRLHSHRGRCFRVTTKGFHKRLLGRTHEHSCTPAWSCMSRY